MYSALEGAIFTVACIAVGDATHLTWWAAALLGTVDLLLASVPNSTFTARAWVASITLSTLVQLTVVLMSVMGCHMIQDALTELGPWTYYAGNFVLHYWPTLRLLAARPSRTLSKTNRGVTYDAARILALYATIFKPEQVYECSDVSPYLVLPLGVVVAAGIEWFVLEFF
jgi:hypothetical protein